MLDFLSLLWHVARLTEKEAQVHEKYNKRAMARHRDDLLKSMTDQQKVTFEKFHDCWSEYMILAEAVIFEYTFRLGSLNKAAETLMIAQPNISREEKGEESTRKGVTENKPSPLKICIGEDKEKSLCLKRRIKANRTLSETYQGK